VAGAYGCYLEGAGISDRATVLIDSGGRVLHASSVTPAGERDLAELAALCEQEDAKAKSATAAAGGPQGLGGAAGLYVRNHCAASRAAIAAVENCHASGVRIENVSEDAGALEALRAASGAETAPCLVVGGDPLPESAQIALHLAERLAPVG